MPEGISADPHLHFVPGSTGLRLEEAWPGVAHWTRPIVPVERSLIAGVGKIGHGYFKPGLRAGPGRGQG